MRYVKLLIVAMLLASCATRNVSAPQPRVLHREGWFAEEREPGKFYVFVKSDQEADEAKKELCSQEYICFGPEHIAEVLVLERKKK